ncbi:MAG TPA: hypothetical protein VN800_02270, partial [Candidatus Acidoferrales bacterium]|nr:hypothetical protein [Candidatus Acidoferrales bacterium]
VFCNRFPTPNTLAAASPADAIRAWAGLGYNRRALALRAAAQRIVEQHGGGVPSDVDALENLPGVGPYTARAVAARAFGVRVIPVDVNVRRVLGRMLGRNPGEPSGTGGAGSLAGVREVQALADALAEAEGSPISRGGPLGAPHAADAARTAEVRHAGDAPHAGRLNRVSRPPHPGDVADALMDLAAAVCRPRAPDCAACPLVPWCTWAAAANGAAPAGPSATGAAPVRPTAVTRHSALTPPGRGGSLVATAVLKATETRPRTAVPPFVTTRRWLRGQLLRELATAPPGAWLAIQGARGRHAPASVRETLASLATEGFVELDERGNARLSEV